MLMGLPTMAIGLVPTYAEWGYGAAVLLVLMRFLQGIAVGGEWGGAALMAVEHAPPGRNALYGSLPQTGVGAGLILSSLAMAAVAKLPEAEMMHWGWRLPFLASVMLLIVGAFIRLRVGESPVFEDIKKHNTQIRQPVVEVFRHFSRPVALAVGARLAETVWFYTVVTFSLSYATLQLRIPKSNMLNAIVIGAVLSLITMPASGWLADKWGARRIYLIGALTMMVAAFAFFALLNAHFPGAIYAAMCLAIGGVFPLLYAPESALFSAQFPAEVRYSGISLCVQLAGAIGGGAAPLIAASLLKVGQGSFYPISIYLMILVVLAAFCVTKMQDSDVG